MHVFPHMHTIPAILVGPTLTSIILVCRPCLQPPRQRQAARPPHVVRHGQVRHVLWVWRPRRFALLSVWSRPGPRVRPAPSPALHLRLVLGAFGPYLECSHCTLPGAGFCPECLPLRRSCADRYALLRIETNLGDKKFDLMKLRNPHGQGGQEWAGNWCGSLEPSRQPCTTTCALALCETQYLRPDEV